MTRASAWRLLATIALAAALLPSAALGNGKPIQIVLTYLPDVSNTGTTSASGVAEVVLAEGEVRLAATGLPRLDPPEHYQAWVGNTRSGTYQAVGAFNTAFTTGAARLDQVLPDPIPDQGWDLFLVTVEQVPSPDSPSNRRSIAGYFPPTGTEPQPGLLPNTGGQAPVPGAAGSQADWLRLSGAGALLAALAGGAGYVLGRRRRRSQ